MDANIDAPKEGGKYNRSKLVWRWLLLWPVALALLINPVGSRLFRGALLLCLLGLLAGALVIAWPRRPLRFALLLITALLAVPLFLPGRPYDPASLRDAYVRNLGRYEGVPYVWGGEKEWGIDCSGFPRRALIRASVGLGLRQFNGSLVREGISLWWHDCSARAMGEGYRGWTRPLFEAASVNAIDCAQLLPGDMAVTANGVHVLVFAGGKEWLEADPGHRRVIRATVPVERNAWFDMPVNVVRWTRISEE